MNLPTLYRTAGPHAAHARSLVAEGTALSISVLADLCEEYSIPSMQYWRNTANTLFAIELFSSVDRDTYQKTHTVLKFENLEFLCRFGSRRLKSQTRIHCTFDCNGTRYIHSECSRSTHELVYTPSTYNIQASPKHRLALARRITFDFDQYFLYFDEMESLWKRMRSNMVNDPRF